MKTAKIIIIIICIFLATPSVIITTIANENPKTSSSDIVDLINQVDKNLLTKYYNGLLEFGIRYTGTDNCTRAGQWIYDTFTDMGLDTEFHEWTYKNFEGKNIIATLPGTDTSNNAIIILSAHYDTVINSPGANDDGSGIVSVLAIAELLSKYDFNQTIRFITFSGEEVGTYGSYNYAVEAYNNNDNIYAVLNLDIIGFAETTEGGRTLRFFHEEPSTWIAEFASEICDKYKESFDMKVEDITNYPGADNQAFVDYGYDGVWIAQNDPNRVGHSPDDNMEHINLTYHVKVTKLMLATLSELAIQPIDIQVIIKTPLEGYLYLQDKPLIPIPFPEYYFLRLRGITVLFGRAISNVEVYCKDKIKQVVFSVDDFFSCWDTEPPYQWNIQGKFYPLFGRHTLKVCAYSESGKMDSDEIDIIFFTLSYQYGRW